MPIDAATLSDVPQLCDLLAILFAQEREFAPDLQKQSAGLRAIVSDSKVGVVLVAREGQRAVGMVVLLWTVSTFHGAKVALLEDLIVHPDERGRGIGSQLLRAAVEHASAADCARITLLTDQANREAQAFYERSGFIPSTMLPMRLMLPGAAPRQVAD